MTATSPAGATRVDPVTAAVIGGALDSIADEMGHKLMRMSHSSIIRESEDFGAALTDAQGRQLCECRLSTPLQSGPIPGYVRGILRALARRGEALGPGDVVMHNDPYAGASHGPDVAFCVPVFHEGGLIGFSVTTAHHLDIGAATPGSCGIVEAVDAYAEGLQFKAIKVVEGGVRNAAVWQILRDNIRAPDLVVGDMEAQVRAAEIGAARFLALVERYGRATVEDACADLMDHSERLMRDAIAALPDGDYSATTFIDGYLDDPDPARRRLPIAVTVRVRGDALTVDLTGTAPEVPDRPINMPFEGTVDCAVWLTLRSILLDSAVHGPVPQNSGLVRPITIVAPEGTLANPRFPAPVIARFCPGNQLADTVMKALAPAVPGKVSAGIGNLRVVAFSGLREGRHWVHMEIMEGSYGGRPGRDGMDAVDTLYANTRNNPIEDIESHLPLRVSRYELREDAAAAGRWRGGIGTVREFAFLEDGGFSVEGDGHAYAPWGFLGGADGRTAALTLVDPDGTETALPSKVPYHRARAGQRLRSEGPCGGGYGPPAERDPEAVAGDIADGFVSAARAARDDGAAPASGAGWPTATGRFALGDLALESGAVLPDAILSWKSYGTLSPARDNVVVYPTSYGAQHADQEWLIGEGGVLDPRRWFVVVPDMFGNGLSSSPSNTPDYPALVTTADNVRAQRRLLSEEFGIDRVAAVYGFSMGGQQAYHWAALFPEAVERAVVVCGSARTSVHNKVFLLSLLATLEAAPEHLGRGRFSSEPRAALRAFARIYAGWAMSQDWYRAGLHLSATGAADLDDFLDRIWEPGFTRRAAADLHAQATTWLHGDIGAAHGGDLAGALGAIRARVLLVPSRTDLYFPVADNAAELPHLARGELRPIPTIWGHRAGNPRDVSEDLAFLRRTVRDWLDAPAPSRT